MKRGRAATSGLRLTDPVAGHEWEWDDDAAAGEWVRERLGAWGTVGGVSVLGLAAYAYLPNDGPAERADGNGHGTLLAQVPPRPDRLDLLLEHLRPFTGEQLCHFALWTGFGNLYDHGTNPQDTGSTAVVTAYGPGQQIPNPVEARRREHEHLRLCMIERPAGPMLALPAREYHLWHGPLEAARAMERARHSPNLMWPEDRSWFVGTEIDWVDTVVAGSATLVDRVLADPELAATATDPAQAPPKWWIDPPEIPDAAPARRRWFRRR